MIQYTMSQALVLCIGLSNYGAGSREIVNCAVQFQASDLENVRSKQASIPDLQIGTIDIHSRLKQPATRVGPIQQVGLCLSIRYQLGSNAGVKGSTCLGWFPPRQEQKRQEPYRGLFIQNLHKMSNTVTTTNESGKWLNGIMWIIQHHGVEVSTLSSRWSRAWI